MPTLSNKQIGREPNANSASDSRYVNEPHFFMQYKPTSRREGVCGQRFPELRAEALTFPVAAHDDLLDALAGAYAKAKVGPSLLLAGATRWSKYAFALDGIMPNPPGDW